MDEQNLPMENLPNWSTQYRGMPNALARSALFCVANRKTERLYYDRSVIFSTNNIKLVYTGTELRQDDLDVFLHVLHLAKEQKMGEDIRFTARSFILSLDWQMHSDSYERLIAALNRMKATSVILSAVDRAGGRIGTPLGLGLGIGFAGSLIGGFSWREIGSGAPLTEWSVSLERNIVQLFAPDTYSLLNWRTRLDLPPLAQHLYTYYCTHKEPFPIKTETLYKLTGSKTKEIRQFRYKLKAALLLLVTSKFFLSAHIDPKSDLVHVVKAADKRRLE